jgi:hypothetical protein
MTRFEKAQLDSPEMVRRTRLEKAAQADQALARTTRKLLAEVREWRSRRADGQTARNAKRPETHPRTVDRPVDARSPLAGLGGGEDGSSLRGGSSLPEEEGVRRSARRSGSHPSKTGRGPTTERGRVRPPGHPLSAIPTGTRGYIWCVIKGNGRALSRP